MDTKKRTRRNKDKILQDAINELFIQIRSKIDALGNHKEELTSLFDALVPLKELEEEFKELHIKREVFQEQTIHVPGVNKVAMQSNAALMEQDELEDEAPFKEISAGVRMTNLPKGPKPFNDMA